MNTALLPRPFSCNVARIDGCEPLIRCEITRVSKSRRTGWRMSVYVDGAPVFTSHHGTQREAADKGAAVMPLYTEIHYRSR